MKQYIVRIYRRDRPGTDRLVGKIETPSRKRQPIFRNKEELRAIMTETGLIKTTTPVKKRKQKKRVVPG